MLLPFEQGYSQTCWKPYSKPGWKKLRAHLARIDNLWMIQIIEADLYMNLCIIFGLFYVFSAGLREKTTYQPYSGGHALIDCQQTSSYWKTDLQWIKDLQCMVFNNDVRAAFDRLIPLVVGIILQRLGASVNAVGALLCTLERMWYKTCTALGNLKFLNIKDWVLGTLQGSGASPRLWLAVMCLLLGALPKRSEGLLFQNPCLMLEVKHIGERGMCWQYGTLKSISQGWFSCNGKGDGRYWAMLATTPLHNWGLLAWDNFFLLLSTGFSKRTNIDSRWPTKCNLELLSHLVTDNYAMQLTIKQTKTNSGNQVLGLRLATYGNNTKDMEILTAKGASMSRNIWESKLTCSEVSAAYEFMLHLSMKYTLCAATTLMEVNAWKLINAICQCYSLGWG